MKKIFLLMAFVAMLASVTTLVASSGPADAQTTQSCPDGFTLTADASACFQVAPTTTSTACATGDLTPDGTACYVMATVTDSEGATACPDGYSQDDSLGTCARFELATQSPDICPTGARGSVGACYILVAKVNAGAAQCSAADAAAGGVVAGTTCVIPGAAPVNGEGRCPTSATVILEGGACFSLLSPTGSTLCADPYVAFGTACKFANPNPLANPPVLATADDCPAIPAGRTLDTFTHTDGGITKVASCAYVPAFVATGCPAAADLGLVNGQCRKSVPLESTGLRCVSNLETLVNGKCVRYTAAVTPAASCPAGTFDSAEGCRKPVADAPGPLTCPSGGTLDGTACVWTTGFTVDPGNALYACAAGTTRSVVGSGSGLEVICLTGTPTASTQVGCLRGVLSVDGAYCVVPVQSSSVAVPVPGFTG